MVIRLTILTTEVESCYDSNKKITSDTIVNF